MTIAFIEFALLGRQFAVGSQPNALELIWNDLLIWCQCFLAAIGLSCGPAKTEADMEVMPMDMTR